MALTRHTMTRKVTPHDPLILHQVTRAQQVDEDLRHELMMPLPLAKGMFRVMQRKLADQTPMSKVNNLAKARPPNLSKAIRMKTAQLHRPRTQQVRPLASSRVQLSSRAGHRRLLLAVLLPAKARLLLPVLLPLALDLLKPAIQPSTTSGLVHLLNLPSAMVTQRTTKI